MRPTEQQTYIDDHPVMGLTSNPSNFDNDEQSAAVGAVAATEDSR